MRTVNQKHNRYSESEAEKEMKYEAIGAISSNEL